MSGRRNIKVLLVDDHPLVIEGIRAVLETYNHIEIVGWAANARDGLAIATRNAPDVVMMDINMPGLDGHDVISALRVMHDDVPIIAISGGSAVGKEELLLQASRLGASEVITKPFEFEQLAGAVSRALGLWRTS